MITSPYLPGYEYIPDGEPHIFGDRLYIFGSHDAFGGKKFCQNDYVCWSCPLDDFNAWRYEGRIYRTNQDPENEDAELAMWAPDVCQGADGQYYLYYCLANRPRIGVAVAKEPAGQYFFLGYVRHEDGTPLGAAPDDLFPFDPAVLRDSDGRIHLYTGQGPRSLKEAEKKAKKNDRSRDTAYHMELCEDMLTVRTDPNRLLPNLTESEGTGFEGHEFFEASSIRRFGQRYYFIYSSVRLHELCWAYSDRPDEGFSYGGTLISNADLGLVSDDELRKGAFFPEGRNFTGNNHGSVVEIGGQYYVFYHRHTGRSWCSRQGCVARLETDGKGGFLQAQMQSSGMAASLPGQGCFEARIASQLYTQKGSCFSGREQGPLCPYFTQDEPDGLQGTQYIRNLRKGAVAGFRSFEGGARFISVTVRGRGKGRMIVRNGEDGPVLAEIELGSGSRDWAGVSAKLTGTDGPYALYLSYEGSGYRDLLDVELYR